MTFDGLDPIAIAHALEAESGEAASGEAFAAYRAAASGHDAMIDADGRIRPHWRAVFASGRMNDWREASAALERHVRESGAAYNVYADPDLPVDDSWRLDLTPLAIDAADWRALEAGVVQRARAIELALRDLWGPRRLLENGVLPAALFWASDAFAPGLANWPDIDQAGGERTSMFSYAIDVAKDEQGRWRALADHTDAPSGIGWALANRIAVAQVSGDAFFEAGVARMSAHVEFEQERIAQAAGEAGLAALLTNGPADPGFFGHAYYARQTSLPTVEPADLTVRGGKVFAKTLGGLQRIDVLVRKVESGELDPLIRARGGLGAPGLAAASRRGLVRLRNDLGAGLADGRAFAPFMPGLIEALLGERPLLEDAPCWWLGDPAGRERYLAGREQLRVSPTSGGDDPVSQAIELELREGDADRVSERLEREGARYVARAPITFATAPVSRRGGLRPRPWAMRVFCAIDGGDISVLPGGWAREAQRPSGVALPNGPSKDVWVIEGRRRNPAAAPAISHPSPARAHLRRTGRDLLSRVADNLFWLGRYVERAETCLRILRTVLRAWIDGGASRLDPALLEKMMRLRLSRDAPAPEADPDATSRWLERAALRLLRDANEPMGYLPSMEAARRNAVATRAQLGQDAWRALNQALNDPRWREGPATLGNLQVVAESGVQSFAAFAGATAETMTRSFAWRFLEIGRRVERGVSAGELIGALAIAPGNDEARALRALLDLNDAYIAYRTRYVMTPAAEPTLDLLALDEANPRSLAYQFAALESLLDGLGEASARLRPEQLLALEARTAIRLASVENLAEIDAHSGERRRLAELLELTDANLSRLSDRLSEAYFAHAERDERAVAFELAHHGGRDRRCAST